MFLIKNINSHISLLIILLLFISFGGCIDQNPTEIISQPHGSDINISVSEETDNPDINYSDIEMLPPYNESNSEWLKTNASNIAIIAVKDSRARQLILEGGTIMGVTYSCHPTPEEYEGPICAPALRIKSGNKIVDFLVDEEKGTVVETVTEIENSS